MNKAEDTLREIAQASNVSMKTIYALVNQVYIDEANHQEKLQKMRQLDVQHKQLQLMELQTSNEKINQVILSYKLERLANRIKFRSKIKSFFKLKRHDKAGNNLSGQEVPARKQPVQPGL